VNFDRDGATFDLAEHQSINPAAHSRSRTDAEESDGRMPAAFQMHVQLLAIGGRPDEPLGLISAGIGLMPNQEWSR
jgi:hypothetical protein